MNGVQGNQAAQVRMFAHDAIPVALGAINPEFGITLDSGGYGYDIDDEVTLNTSGTAAKIKVTSLQTQNIINVQAQSGAQFYLNGRQLGSGKLVLIRGRQYTFYQKLSSNSSHILAFSSTDPAVSATSYTTGVDATGTPGTTGVTTFTVDPSAPSQLWYYCTAHSGMQGEIEIKDSGDDFFATYPNNKAINGFELVRQSGGKPFGAGYSLNDKVQPGIETYDITAAPSAFIGSVSSIDLASTDQRGACIYVGVKMTSITAKMESGVTAVFKDVAAGSFMPILVKEITTATPDGGSPGVISDNDILALY